MDRLLNLLRNGRESFLPSAFISSTQIFPRLSILSFQRCFPSFVVSCKSWWRHSSDATSLKIILSNFSCCIWVNSSIEGSMIYQEYLPRQTRCQFPVNSLSASGLLTASGRFFFRYAETIHEMNRIQVFSLWLQLCKGQGAGKPGSFKCHP
jgi:hypothetical protein